MNSAGFHATTRMAKHWLADEQTIAETAILYDADDVIYDENQGYLLWHTGEEVQWADV